MRWVSLLMVLVLVPSAFALWAGGDVDVVIEPQASPPQVYLCNSRVMYDDNTAPGRIHGAELEERIGNYAFEGEQISMKVMAVDRDGIEDIKGVYAIADGIKEAQCRYLGYAEPDYSCNIQEEVNAEIASYYQCLFTVEEGDTIYGEQWYSVMVEDDENNTAEIDEKEWWFLNPMIAINIDNDIEFENVKPGTTVYSKEMVLVQNYAEADSGVMLDMFITGTDFYDSSDYPAMCPTSNQLSLSNFRYYLTKGAYSTKDDLRADSEGYVPINYGTGFNNPRSFYNYAEILQAKKVGPYYKANILAPGETIALRFKLNVPSPCSGQFDTGKIMFWGEAI